MTNDESKRHDKANACEFMQSFMKIMCFGQEESGPLLRERPSLAFFLLQCHHIVVSHSTSALSVILCAPTFPLFIPDSSALAHTHNGLHLCGGKLSAKRLVTV